MDADDPLDPYHRLLLWYQSHQSIGTCRLAKNQNGDDVFKYLAVNEIGQMAAVYYEEYAAYLEVNRRFKDSDETYRLGINRNALPLERLKRKYAAFIQRWDAEKQRALEDGEDVMDESKVVRPVLGGDKSKPSSRATTSIRAQPSTKSQPVKKTTGSTSSNAKLIIFQDPEPPLKTLPASIGSATLVSTVRPELEIERSRRKENEVLAEPWRATTIAQAGTVKAVTGKLEDVFVQRGAEKHATGNVLVPKRVFEVIDGKSHLDALLSDEPTALETAVKSGNAAREGMPKESTRSLSGNVKVENVAPVAAKPLIVERFVWDINVILKDGEEFSFEEIRSQSETYKFSLNMMAEAENETTPDQTGKPAELSVLKDQAVKPAELSVLKDQAVKPAELTGKPAELSVLKDQAVKPAELSVLKDQAVNRPELSVLKEAPKLRPILKTISRTVEEALVTIPTPRVMTVVDDDDSDDDAVGGLEVSSKRITLATGFVAKNAGLPSPTINTKAALADIFEMFNAPLQEESKAADSHMGWFEVVNEEETVSSKVFKMQSVGKLGVFCDEDESGNVPTELSLKAERNTTDPPKLPASDPFGGDRSFDRMNQSFERRHAERESTPVLDPESPFLQTHENDDSQDEDYPEDQRTSSRPSFGRGGFRQMFKDAMTPITEVSFEGDRTIAGLSTIGASTFRYGGLSTVSSTRGRDSLDMTNFTFGFNTSLDTISSISATGSQSDLSPGV
ncbi:hypothetical protein BC829DRAFT_417716 [Chytridium lagenaria]|nr:hypothetical protein BC829DRAFT_417716 [Chytridium lagenaria]